MKEKFNIEKLTQTEAGTLKGGFVALSKPSDSEAHVNGNCSENSQGWYNHNCGCGTCGTSQETS